MAPSAATGLYVNPCFASEHVHAAGDGGHSSSEEYFVPKIDKLLADHLKWTPPGWKSPDTCGSLSHAPICKSYVPYCTVLLHQQCMFSCVFVLSPSTVLFRRMTQAPKGINYASQCGRLLLTRPPTHPHCSFMNTVTVTVQYSSYSCIFQF